MTRTTPLATIACCSTVLLAQSPQWQQLNTAPQPPATGSIVHDHLRDRVVLMAQNGWPTSPQSEHWELGPQGWVVRALPAALAQRAGAALAYDGTRNVRALFGGLGGGVLGDTWLHDGANWQQVAPANSPPARTNHSMVYDEARGRVVLAGGLGLAFYWFAMDDTWEWDGTAWLQRASLPGWRASLALAYDSRRARTIAYGGVSTASGWPGLSHYDAWYFDGASWRTLAATGPSPVVQSSAMCYDRERDRCVLIGRSPTTGVGELWEYDGASWTLDPETPPGFGFARLAYDRQRGRVVALGPDATFQARETWIRATPGLAVAQPYGRGCGAPAMRCIPDAASRPLLGATLAVDVAGVPAGVAFMCFGWSNEQVLGLPLPFAMDGFGLPGCWLLQSDDAITLPCAPTGPGTARFSFAIPAEASFTGLRFFLQPWGPAPGVNAGGGIVGDAVAVTIGSS